MLSKDIDLKSWSHWEIRGELLRGLANDQNRLEQRVEFEVDVNAHEQLRRESFSMEVEAGMLLEESFRFRQRVIWQAKVRRVGQIKNGTGMVA